jgi:hypothetical protein
MVGAGQFDCLVTLNATIQLIGISGSSPSSADRLTEETEKCTFRDPLMRYPGCSWLSRTPR